MLPIELHLTNTGEGPEFVSDESYIEDALNRLMKSDIRFYNEVQMFIERESISPPRPMSIGAEHESNMNWLRKVAGGRG